MSGVARSFIHKNQRAMISLIRICRWWRYAGNAIEGASSSEMFPEVYNVIISLFCRKYEQCFGPEAAVPEADSAWVCEDCTRLGAGGSLDPALQAPAQSS